MANIIQINGKKVKDVNAARMSSLAPVESSTTASMAHAVGDYFWLNGTLYEATAAITVGNAISVGTNCKITNMGENLADLKSQMSAVENYALDGVFVIPTSFIEQGAISSSGADASSSTRLRTKNIAVKNGASFSFSAGTATVNVYWYFYANDGTVTHASAWLADGATLTFTSDGDARFMFKKSGSSDSIVPSEYDAITIIASKLKNDIDSTQNKAECIGKRAGKNLYSGQNEVSGYLNSDGSIHSSTSWVISDYVNVEGIGSLTLSGYYTGQGRRNHYNFYFLCTYGENKSFIERVGTQVANPYTVGEGVKYIRFCLEVPHPTDMMLEAGTTMSAYEPYTEYNILKNSLYIEEGRGHFYGKRWAVMGDSLTEKNARAVQSYYDYISDELGIEIVNYGVSGTGYARGTNTFVSRMLTIDPSKFDVMTVFGSFNDGGSELPIGNVDDTGTETICGCINTALDNYFATSPYKPIGLVTPCPWASYPITSTYGNDYADAIIAIAKKRGVPYLDLFRESGIRPWTGVDYREMYYLENGVQDDGTHPNSLGHKVFLYPHFREFIKSILD